MPTRLTVRRTSRTLTAAALLAAAVGWGVVGEPAASAERRAPAPGGSAPATLCAQAGTLKGENGQRASVNLCASSGGPTMSVSAPATCRRAGTSVAYACTTSGSWTARRAGETVASGTLPGGRDYPGPGTYDISGEVHVRSTPAGVDLRGRVHATLTLSGPKAAPTHRIDVDRDSLRAGSATTVTYTVARESEQGDGSARFGLIGEEGSGVELTTSDPRCVNPLTGRYPSTERSMHALDCALTELQPGRPDTVVVHVSLPESCSTVVSKLGYWMPQGQAVYTGGMLVGPTLTCADRPSAPGARRDG
ncbi:hypothetical protein ACIPJS_06615 [Streptomyces sp. NPDC086783]|uniref:hypothetical protein n=1 Tax=Streptomyces sp. NPDC086783 TaxID=3365758 RepID=UPI003801935E